jgi:hypothetical protein
MLRRVATARTDAAHPLGDAGLRVVEATTGTAGQADEDASAGVNANRRPVVLETERPSLDVPAGATRRWRGRCAEALATEQKDD